MRWFVARDEDGQPTMNALAIAETVAAVGASFLVVWQVGLAPLLVGATLAPLLLLRTERSTEWGLASFRRFANSYEPRSLFRFSQRLGLVCSTVLFAALILSWMIREHFRVWVLLDLIVNGWGWWSLLLIPIVFGLMTLAFGLVWVFWGGCSMILAVCVAALFAIVVRLAVTVASAVVHPIESVKAIAHNWFRVALCDNLTVMPELAAGISGDAGLRERFSLRAFVQSYIEEAKYVFPASDDTVLQLMIGFAVIVCGLLAVTLFFLPALLYRFSLKSTSYLYLLLLGVIGVLYGKYRVFGNAPATERLEHASGDRLSLVFGVLTFAYVLVLPITVAAFVRLLLPDANALPRPLVVVVDFFTVHPAFGWSNVMQLTNGLLALLTLPLAWLAVRRPHFAASADHGVRLMVFARGVLTVGLILWFLAVLWHEVGWEGVAKFARAVWDTISDLRFDPSLPGGA